MNRANVLGASDRGNAIRKCGAYLDPPVDQLGYHPVVYYQKSVFLPPIC